MLDGHFGLFSKEMERHSALMSRNLKILFVGQATDISEGERQWGGGGHGCAGECYCFYIQ